jgi:hypothetical protein
MKTSLCGNKWDVLRIELGQPVRLRAHSYINVLKYRIDPVSVVGFEQGEKGPAVADPGENRSIGSRIRLQLYPCPPVDGGSVTVSG